VRSANPGQSGEWTKTMTEVSEPMTEADTERAERFQSAMDAAREHGEVSEPDPDGGVFLFGPVEIDTIYWISERDGMRAVSRVERDGREWMTVMVE
jgi:hypothetical protein